jgi:hypothetical protein
MRKYLILLMLGTGLTLLVAAALSRTYKVGEIDNSRFFCQQDECLLVISHVQRGWDQNRLAFPVHMVRSLLGVPNSYSERRQDTVVVRITNNGVEQHNFERYDVGLMDMWQGRLYVRVGKEVWTGKSFDQVDAGVRDAYLAAQRNGATDMGRYLLDGQSVLIAINGRSQTLRKVYSAGNISIQLADMSGAGDVLWQANRDVRTVSKQQYQETFGR